MVRKAAIDIGTNSVRLLVVDFNGVSFQPVYKSLKSTRLGTGVDSRGVLGEDAIDRTLEAIKMFKEHSLKMGAKEIVAVATSAVRDARNGAFFTRKVEELGLKVRVVKGEEEAKLGFYGALLGSDFTEDKVLMVDIGGGSTELVLGTKTEIDFMTSMNIGAVRLTERFIKNDPVSREEIYFIRQYVQDELAKLGYGPSRGEKISMVGIGGTITSLAAIAQGLVEYKRKLVHQFMLSRSCIEEITDRISKLPLRARRKVPGLQPERADIIIAGAVILISIMDFWEEDSITVSEWDNLEGILYQELILSDKITGSL